MSTQAASNVNSRLALGATVLLVLSVLVYWNSVARADRFERGQKFLSNLNPDEITEVVIIEAGETVTLRRVGEEFVVAEADGYRAKNESVNRFIRDLLDISLDKEVGTGETLEADLEIEPTTETTQEITLKNASGQEMVSVRVGKGLDDGPGNYVQRRDVEGEPIFLTSERVSLSSEQDSFLQKEIVDVTSSQLLRVEGPGYVFAKGEEDGASLELLDVPAGKKESSVEVNKVKNLLSRLRFEQVYPADDAEVRDLAFQEVLRYELDDGSGYVVSAAVGDERSFLSISGFHTIERIEIELDTPEEELQEKADVLSRADEMNEFNSYHGSWVYEVDSTTGEKLVVGQADLLEDAE